MPVSAGPVTVLVTVDPATSHRANEAVRIALGIVAGESAVTIALLGPGAKALDAEIEEYVDGEDLWKHLGTLARLGTVFHVERDRVPPDRSGWNPVGVPVVPVDGPWLAATLAASRRVLIF